ncbi:hypothetical protein CIK05_09190 [Bdellovibrio sp. qaytius]|nr:hypothetical protein CIK05_09190 [Bdellovibrio sp. qaytius]
MKFILAALLLITTLSAEASFQCLDLFKKPAAEILEDINNENSNFLYQENISDNFAQSSLIKQKYNLYKLKKMFKELDKQGQKFDQHDLAIFVYELDKLAFANSISDKSELNKKLTYSDKKTLSDVRRRLLMDGISKYLPIPKSNTGFWRKFFYYFSEAFSVKYLRWTTAQLWMPKLYGPQIPLELAKKIALDGLEAHQKEVEKYIPSVNRKAYFNAFSKTYNILIVTSLFTVLPYLTHDFYVEQMKIGEQAAVQMLNPIVESTREMANTDYILQKEEMTLEIYAQKFTEKHGRAPTDQELNLVRERLHNK